MGSPLPRCPRTEAVGSRFGGGGCADDSCILLYILFFLLLLNIVSMPEMGSKKKEKKFKKKIKKKGKKKDQKKINEITPINCYIPKAAVVLL